MLNNKKPTIIYYLSVTALCFSTLTRAEEQNEALNYCLTVGMDDYLTKPFQTETLHALLKQYTGASNISDLPALAEPLPIDNPHVNPEPLAMLRILGGTALVRKALQLFLVNTPLQLAAIRTSLLTGDMETVRHAAHSLKSTSANVGTMQLSKLAGTLEQAARDGLPGTDSTATCQLEQAYHEALKILQQETEST